LLRALTFYLLATARLYFVIRPKNLILSVFKKTSKDKKIKNKQKKYKIMLDYFIFLVIFRLIFIFIKILNINRNSIIE
jgi:hypothetical protein